MFVTAWQRRAATAVLPGFLTGWLLICAPAALRGDSWQITPSTVQTPGQDVLSVAEFHVDIKIDGGHAIVSIREVFRNKTNGVLEGTFGAALSGDASISDFAVWDDVVRIPGVILERKRAGELYDQIRAMQIDPGLLQSGEVSESNAEGEAKRDDEHFCHAAVWEYQGTDKTPVRNIEPLEFENVHLSERSYK